MHLSWLAWCQLILDNPSALPCHSPALCTAMKLYSGNCLIHLATCPTGSLNFCSHPSRQKQKWWVKYTNASNSLLIMLHLHSVNTFLVILDQWQNPTYTNISIMNERLIKFSISQNGCCGQARLKLLKRCFCLLLPGKLGSFLSSWWSGAATVPKYWMKQWCLTSVLLCW